MACGAGLRSMAMGARGWTTLGLLALSALAACGGSQATTNRTFYNWALGSDARAFERAYPALDWPKNSENPAFSGVSVLGGAVRFSRPRTWRMRQASNRPDEPYVHYVSTQAYAFAVYQRRDRASDPWKDILARYEEDVQASGARIVARPVPVAVWRGRGWVYGIERDVPAAQAPLLSRSREMLLRGRKRVVLAQIVHQEKDFEDVDDELLRVVESLRLD